MGRDGHGMGPRMMSSHGRFGPLAALNLSDAQRDRIFKILESDQRQRWAVMGKMMEDTHKMREQLALEQPDPGKVGAIYSQISALRQQIIVAHVRASNEIHNVLTAKQREQLQQQSRRGGCGPLPGRGFHPDSLHGGPGGSMP
ncbi:MAG: Spy/CpxP family protein refolding chaperone [Acidiferrobacterales bacterium]